MSIPLDQLRALQDALPEGSPLLEQLLTELAESERRRLEAEAKLAQAQQAQATLKQRHSDLAWQLRTEKAHKTEAIRLSVEKLNVDVEDINEAGDAEPYPSDFEHDNVVDVLSCSSIGNSFVFSATGSGHSNQNSGMTPIDCATAEHLVSPRLQKFFGVTSPTSPSPWESANASDHQGNHQGSHVRHVKHNQDRKTYTAKLRRHGRKSISNKRNVPNGTNGFPDTGTASSSLLLKYSCQFISLSEKPKSAKPQPKNQLARQTVHCIGKQNGISGSQRLCDTTESGECESKEEVTESSPLVSPHNVRSRDVSFVSQDYDADEINELQRTSKPVSQMVPVEQSNTQPECLSPKCSGCVLTPADSGKKKKQPNRSSIKRARDSVKLKNNKCMRSRAQCKSSRVRRLFI